MRCSFQHDEFQTIQACMRQVPHDDSLGFFRRESKLSVNETH